LKKTLEVEFNDPEWVSKRLKEDGEVTGSSGFTFEAADLLKLPRSAAPVSQSTDSNSRRKKPAITGFRVGFWGTTTMC
jgi:hypothetical protein